MPNPESIASRRLVSEVESAALGTTPGSQAFKFVIGFFASVCAVFLPKIIVYLKNEGDGTLRAISIEYVVAGAIFAALVGFVILLFEWGKRSKPGDVFMSALGIPALVSGTLVTVGTADNLKQQSELRQWAVDELAKSSGIVIQKEAITLPTAPGEPRASLIEFVPSAHAAEFLPQPIVVAQSAYGVQAVRRDYLVVLGQTGDRRQAEAQANSARSKVPGATVVQSGSTFYVVAAARPVPEQAALQQALALRNAGVPTSLVPVRN